MSDYESASPLGVALQMSTVMVIIGGVAVAVLPMTRCTAGASRSVHIKWQKRSEEVNAAIETTEKKDESFNME